MLNEDLKQENFAKETFSMETHNFRYKVSLKHTLSSACTQVYVHDSPHKN